MTYVEGFARRATQQMGLSQHPVRFGLGWLVAGCLDLPFIELFFSGEASWIASHQALGLILHGLASLVLGISVGRPRRGERGPLTVPRVWTVAWAFPFFFWSLFFPVFGWIMSLCLVATHRMTPLGSGGEDEEGLETVSPLGRAFGPPSKGRREKVLEALDFLPLVDIMAGDEIDLKRGAIEKLSQLKTPEAISILLRHRNDSSLEVRFYVTSALTRIQKEFDEELRAARQEIVKARDSFAAKLYLAKVYLRYAASHLLDETTSKGFGEEALFHLKDLRTVELISKPLSLWGEGRERGSLPLIPPPSGATFSPKGEGNKVLKHVLEGNLTIFEFYIHRQEWEEALKVISRIETGSVIDDRELLKAKMDILYRKGCYAEIPAEFQKLRALGPLEGPWHALAAWWDEGGVR